MRASAALKRRYLKDSWQVRLKILLAEASKEIELHNALIAQFESVAETCMVVEARKIARALHEEYVAYQCSLERQIAVSPFK